MRPTNINADMSHQNSMVYKIGEVKNSLKENGIFLTLKKLGQRIFYQLKGVDFSTQNIYDLTRTGEYQEHGTALVSSSHDFLSKLIDDLEDILDKPLNKELFVDYGSGKGAAIIHAKRLGFKRAIGVEFAKELHAIAHENIQKFNLKNVESLYADATTYLPPSDVSVIYLFNPFDAIVMEKVIENLIHHKDSFKNDVHLIYGNASCDVLPKYLKLIGSKRYPSGSTADFYKI